MSAETDFDDFYRSTRQWVLQCVYALCGDLGEAQDAVQEAYVRAWQRWRQVSAMTTNGNSDTSEVSVYAFIRQGELVSQVSFQIATGFDVLATISTQAAVRRCTATTAC